MSFLITFEKYLTQLDSIAQDHDELSDTDVRERLHEVINWYFIWGNPIDGKFPKKYAMFTEVGDKEVAKATREFIEQACKDVVDVPVGQARNDLIENSDIELESGATFDWYLGSIDEVLPAELPTSDDIYSDYEED
jgi:hypothetical protein